MSPSTRATIVNILRKAMSAVAVAFLLALLGVFSSVGYHVYSIEGVSFAPNFDYGYVQVRFGLDAVHNPLLYPYYWLNGKGRVLGNFSMAYFVEAGASGGQGMRVKENGVETDSPLPDSLRLMVYLLKSAENDLYCS